MAGVKQEPEQCEVSSESSMMDDRPAARISGTQNDDELIICYLCVSLTNESAN